MSTQDEEGLRKAILKAGLVRSSIQRWEKVSGEPIKSSHQEIVEIGIDDLMQLITSHFHSTNNSLEEK